MSFQQEPTRTPVDIGNMIITLKDSPARAEQEAYQAAYFDIKVELSDESVTTRSGDLVPHLTIQERDALMNLLTVLRARAVDQIL